MFISSNSMGSERPDSFNKNDWSDGPVEGVFYWSTGLCCWQLVMDYWTSEVKFSVSWAPVFTVVQTKLFILD